MCYVYELLHEKYDVSAYYYNPNIMPVDEYNKRFRELEGFSNLKKFELLETEPDRKEWIRRIRPLRYLGERSQRCHECYHVRLEQTFRMAEKEKFDIVASSLSISPHKDADAINHIGASLSSEYGIPFHEADFKKKDGFKKSAAMSRSYGFYRQDYCGCIYSMLEKDPGSEWSKHVRAEKEKNIQAADSLEVQVIEPGAELDLHHFNPSDTEKLVNEYLRIAVKKGYTEVRIIHGKGKSRIKQRVYAVLENHPAVNSFHDDSYNWGATVIRIAQSELC